ncbi:flagellar hook-associated protein 1 [Clostridium homopropionicum DSM 5847]|uniref:Flagellar hook-associated protein 1 n=1 Tax=Clostridium homopropionicum DSM 5847 TaxID=1121318 RepID=A0A0L6ZDJ8_9CLOT|nr:flagellar hook-associated protein FlgK [Clostridium homopropionicum]KOA21051.1 flagellar hook-associated protein 1 [Clostridium homopropionicum DSM 5847]SFF98480.1 flagellar hook-associated protein 1 FlgK [Clostridium homopropionicum]
MSGLFATFNVGKRGLFAQQKAIDVTSHNIANANTEGYSRQRAIMETTRPFGMPALNSISGPGQVGTGVEVSAIQRIRDNFMDFQVRRENSTLGQYEARDKYLSEIENIFNEPSDTGISTLIGKFFDSWEQLSKQAETSNARTIVAQQSAALADGLNHAYNQLTELKRNAQESIKQSVYDSNALLDRIDKLNQQIISVKVSGMEPNDLMDKRDLLLDELSQKFNINVEDDNFYSINLKPEYTSTPDGSREIENPLLVRKNPNEAVRRLSYVKTLVPDDGQKQGEAGVYTITYLRNGDKDQEATFKVKIDSEEEYKRLEQCRVIWSQNDKNNDSKDGLAIDVNGAVIESDDTIEFEKLGLFELKNDTNRGELKGYMSVQKDVDDYIEQLNKLAKAVAFSVNAVHSGKTASGEDYMPFFVNSEAAKYTINGNKNYLYDINNPGDTTNLTNVLNAEVDINAGNISINKQILDDVMQIKTRTNDDQFNVASLNDVDGEKDGKRALAIAQLRDALIKIQSIDVKYTDRESFIKNMTGAGGGTGALTFDSDLGLNTISSNINGMKVDSYFKDTIDKLGVQEQEAQRIVKNQGVLLQGFQERRDSISGVSLDEEMANLVQYQHAYQANAKIVATVDELLDVVVNGLKR